jgi:hypothetical protein
VIQSEREKLKSLYKGLPEIQLVAAGVEETWSIKDILAHIAAWERVAIDIIQSAKDGEPPKSYINTIFKDIDKFNAGVFEKNQILPLAEVINEFEASHDDFVELIESIPEDFIFSNLPFEGTEELTIQYIISANTHWHYSEHAESIQKWLGS